MFYVYIEWNEKQYENSDYSGGQHARANVSKQQ